jgi:transcriptional regulator with XRE-family HTH domain
VNRLTIQAVSVVDARRVTKNGPVLDAAKRKRIGARLRALRVEQGLDQIEVAQLAQISPGTLQTIEWGVRENRETNIDKVARVLGTSLDALEQKPHVDPTDPLLKGLNREDLEIARDHHEASSAVRERARSILRDRDPLALPDPSDEEIEALAHRVARLTAERRQLLIDLLIQLESLEDRADKVG